MGNKAKKVSKLSDADLARKIDRIVAIRPVANEYKALLDEVKEEMQAREIGKYETELKNTAVCERKTGFTWLADKLAKVKSLKDIFDTVCPRKPDTKKLNQRLAACPEDKALAACRVEVPGKVEIKVHAPGELVGPEVTEEEELAA